MADRGTMTITTFKLHTVFKRTLSTMFDKMPGNFLKRLIDGLIPFNNNRRIVLSYGGDVIESFHIAMFISQTIVHFAFVMSHSSDCLVDVSLDDIKQCRNILRKIRTYIIDYEPNSNYFTENLADQYLEALEEMKQLDRDVSILLSLFRLFHIYYVLNVCYVLNIYIYIYIHTF